MVKWVGKGMPGLMVIPRKPTPIGLELHTLCDSQSGIMVNFEVYEGKEAMENKEFVNERNDIGVVNKSTALTLRCLKPFFSSGRVVIADSWFGQVACALELFRRGLFCIMNVKTATKGYPKAALLEHVGEIKGSGAAARAERSARRGKSVAFVKTFKVGARSVTLTAAGNNKKVPLLLIASASSMVEGEEHVKRWTTRDASGEATLHELRTTQPEMHQIYREYMNLIDLHNKLRQGETSMADAWHTHYWENRHFAEMLGIIEVNIYLSLKYFKKGLWCEMSHNEFRRRLAHAFLTLGKEPFPEDGVQECASVSSGSRAQQDTPPTTCTTWSSASLSSGALSASDLFAGPGVEHQFASYNAQTRENHTCAYCGTLTTKFCLSCSLAGRGKIAVCGRRSGRDCIDKHASGAQVKHASWKLESRDDDGRLGLRRKSKRCRNIARRLTQ